MSKLGVRSEEADGEDHLVANEWLVYRGRHFSIQWARTLDGEAPARLFFDSLTVTERAQVLAQFERLGDHGRISNKEHFKKVETTELWEFKKFQIRFIGAFRPERHFVLAIGLKKKKDRHRAEDLARARRVLSENDSAKSG